MWINQNITASSDTSACRAEWEQIPGSNGTCYVLLGTLLQPKDGSCCCGGSGSYDAQRPVLSAPVALAAVGAAAGGVLAVDGPTILVTALQPVVDNLRHAVLRIRGGPVAALESSRTLNTATRIGLHIPYFLILLYSPILLGVCQGQLGDVLQIVCVGGETGDAEEGSLKLTMVWPYWGGHRSTRSIQNTTPRSPWQLDTNRRTDEG